MTRGHNLRYDSGISYVALTTPLPSEGISYICSRILFQILKRWPNWYQQSVTHPKYLDDWFPGSCSKTAASNIIMSNLVSARVLSSGCHEFAWPGSRSIRPRGQRKVSAENSKTQSISKLAYGWNPRNTCQQLWAYLNLHDIIWALLNPFTQGPNLQTMMETRRRYSYTKVFTSA